LYALGLEDYGHYCISYVNSIYTFPFLGGMGSSKGIPGRMDLFTQVMLLYALAQSMEQLTNINGYSHSAKGISGFSLMQILLNILKRSIFLSSLCLEQSIGLFQTHKNHHIEQIDS